MPKAYLNTGKYFDVAERQSVLSSALAAGVLMPYSCQTGRCETCKAKLVSGDTAILQDEIGLSDVQKRDGWILTCCRSAVSDLVIDVEDLSEFDLPEPRTFPARINRLELVAHDIMRVVLRLPPIASFRFLAGQYIDLIGPGGVTRSYSLAGYDQGRQLLELHIRAVTDGELSRYWFDKARINDLLRLRGPLGTFFLRRLNGLDLVFLATGTGIAPVKAMLDSLVDSVNGGSTPRSVTVIWGGRIQSDLYLDFSAQTIGYTYIPVLSRAHQDWAGRRGYVQDALLSYMPDLSGVVVYACGSPAMIESSRERLVEAGLELNHFFADAFLPSGKQ